MAHYRVLQSRHVRNAFRGWQVDASNKVTSQACEASGQRNWIFQCQSSALAVLSSNAHFCLECKVNLAKGVDAHTCHALHRGMELLRLEAQCRRQEGLAMRMHRVRALCLTMGALWQNARDEPEMAQSLATASEHWNYRVCHHAMRRWTAYSRNVRYMEVCVLHGMEYSKGRTQTHMTQALAGLRGYARASTLLRIQTAVLQQQRAHLAVTHYHLTELRLTFGQWREQGRPSQGEGRSMRRARQFHRRRSLPLPPCREACLSVSPLACAGVWPVLSGASWGSLMPTSANAWR